MRRGGSVMNNNNFNPLYVLLIVIPAIILVLTFKDYAYLLTGTVKGLPGWGSFFLPILIWLILINVEPFDKGSIRSFLSTIITAAVILALMKWATLIMHEMVYESLKSIKTDDIIKPSNVKAFTQTILTLPGIVVLTLAGGLIYKIREHPLIKYIYSEYKLTEGFSFKLGDFAGKYGGDKPDIELCIDRTTNKKVFIPFIDMFRHLFVLGPTGCGKTSLFLIPIAWQLVKNEAIGLIAIDPKGDFAHYIAAMCRYLKRPHILVDPILKDCPYYNPLVGDENDVIENSVTTFEMLMEGSISYFKNQCTRLLRNTIRMLKRLYGDDANFIMVNNVFNNINGFGMECLAKLSRLEGEEDFKIQNREIINYFQENYYVPKSKSWQDTDDIRNQVANLIDNKYLRKILNPPSGKGSDINFDQFLKDGGVIAISLAQGPLRGLARYFGLFIQMSFQSSVFKRPLPEKNRRPIYEIIDEMQVIANEQFTEMVQQARGLRCSVIAATQSLDQIVLKLGNKGKAFLAAIKTNFQNRVIFAGLPPEDALIFSNWSGLKIEDKITKSESKSKFSLFFGLDKMKAPTKTVSISEQEKVQLSIDEIMYLEAKEIVYFRSVNMKIMRPSIGLADWIPEEYHTIFENSIEELLIKDSADPQYTKTIINNMNKERTVEEKTTPEDINITDTFSKDKEPLKEDQAHTKSEEIEIIEILEEPEQEESDPLLS